MKKPTKQLRPAQSLTTTLALAFFTLSVVALLISSSLQLVSDIQTQQRAVSSNQQLIAQDAAVTVSSFIHEKFSALETAVWLTDLDAASAEVQLKSLQSLLGLQPSFRQLILLNIQEEIVAQASRVSLKASAQSDEQLTTTLLEQTRQNERYISAVYIDPVTSEPLVTMAVPVIDVFEEFKGVLIAEVNLKFMWELVDNLQIGERGQAYVVDRQGNLLAFGDSALVLKGENVAYIHEVQHFINDTTPAPKTAVHTYQGITGMRVVGTYVPLGTPDWAVVTELPWEEAYQSIIRNVLLSIAIILVMAVTAGILGVYLARRLSIPLVNLMETATRIAGGERELQAVVGGPREVASLAIAFNSMTAELRQMLAGLEQRVAERTADLQRANQELVLAKRAAEEASELKTRFLANMSHELRTPLNAILNFTRFLSKERYGVLTLRQQELQQRVISNAEHLLGLINDILDLAKIESGRIELFYEEVDLVPVLQGVMATAIGLTKDKDISLSLETPDELPLVHVDKTRIRQVLLNLLSNAAKFTRQGNITVRANVVGETVEIAVQDTGIGIALEHQMLIFEEFRQVQDDLQREHQGTGLGLPISKRLIEMHGGQLWVKSSLGAGSTFTFSLPLVSKPIIIPPLAEPAVPLAGPAVVVVDDDPEAQHIMAECLSALACQVYPVLDSRLAVSTIRRIRPSLIILDIVMAPLDGWDVLLQLRNDPELALIPVVICSVVDQPSRGLALGANDYLVKPVDEAVLLVTVQRWLHQPATVLVIDDDADARQIVRTALEGMHQVIEATNGLHGLDLIQSDHPDLVVLDLMMPELDGFTVLERMRNNPATANTPVVIVTAKDLEPHERAWLSARAQALNSKSQLTTDSFVTILDQILGKEHRLT